jgi:putative ABC transport system permease protein
MLGTVLGVGAFVAVLGLTATGAGQISAAFSTMSATQITVKDVGAKTPDPSSLYNFPADAEARIDALNGVRASGITWPAAGGPMNVTSSLLGAASPVQIGVDATSPGYMTAAQFHVTDGGLIDAFHNDHAMSVAVIGTTVARQLGIGSTEARPAIFIDGAAFTVVGIVSGAERDPAAANTIYLPMSTARSAFGPPLEFSRATMLVSTELGAARSVAREVPLALRPDDPQVLTAQAPLPATKLRADVMGSLNGLFLILAAITLIIGAVGIANTTLVAVMERTNEIGLRRSIGAQPRHITTQFLTESAILGTLGGLLGTALAVVVVVTVALTRHWTAIVEPLLTVPAPLIGTITGVLAGLYPALRASRIEPLEALRR